MCLGSAAKTANENARRRYKYENERRERRWMQTISIYNAQKPLVIEMFLQNLSTEQSELVSTIIMNNESNVLHDWERKNIVIKDKKTEIGRWLQQTILNLRCLLIQEKIGELQNQTTKSHIETHREILEEVNDYVGLKKNLSKRLDRVIF